MTQTQTSVPTCTWVGKSSKSYTYHVYPIGQSFKAAAGNYIFAKIENGKWKAVYIGETKDLSERFDNHHQMPCIKRNGATHIQAHLNAGGDQARRDEETDVRNNYTTACNAQ